MDKERVEVNETSLGEPEQLRGEVLGNNRGGLRWKLPSNPETQLFLDYLKGRILLDPSQLKEFKAKVNPSKHMLIGKEDGKSIQIGFSKNFPFEPYEEVICRPKHDPSLDYQWLEIYSIQEGIEKMVAARRFFPNDTRFYEWKGTEIQAFIDWVMGNIPFDKVKQFTATIDGKMKSKSFHKTSNLDVVIELHLIGSSIVSQGDTVLVVPNKDDLYEWLEVFKVQDGVESNSLPHVISYRINREGSYKLDRYWLGTGKQRIIDYLNGTVTADKLKPFKVKIGAKNQIYLFVYKDQSRSIALMRSEKFSENEEVTINPIVEDGKLLLKVFKNALLDPVEIFVFEDRKAWFPRLNQTYKPPHYWTEETTEQEGLAFFEEEGELTQKRLAARGRNDLLGAIAKYPGRIRGLRRSLGLDNKPDIKPHGYWKDNNTAVISPDEANEDLDRLLEG